MYEIGESWTRPLKDQPLQQPHPFLYAFAGSFPWLWVNLSMSDLGLLDESGADVVVAIVTLVAQIVLGLWFAWLISYQDRKCSPSRFFLEGLLFPGIAAALLGGSLLTRLVEWLGGG